MMFRSLTRSLAIFSLTLAVACSASKAAVRVPDPAVDTPLAKTSGSATLVLAGGCFWGVQGVFQHVKGVTSVTSGYSGGAANTAEYETVSTGSTGHAESVRIVYDPSKVSLGQLLKVFFSVAHDPTELNRQGPDDGTQYRSVIFYGDDEQKRIAQAYIDQLNRAKVFDAPIVTQLTALKGFYPAEGYHQDYLKHHPHEPYIMFNDLPKLDHLHKTLPDLYVANAVSFAPTTSASK
jgi:peptide-methionine (S)-S-oxide reductase